MSDAVRISDPHVKLSDGSFQRACWMAATHTCSAKCKDEPAYGTSLEAIKKWLNTGIKESGDE